MSIPITVKYFVNYFWVAPTTGLPVFHHERTERWETTKFYCPNCGAQTVYRDVRAHDGGQEHICVSCASSFSMFEPQPIDPGSYSDQRLLVLKAQPQ
jgi:predicted RNA-binding Zn-ribbon protein involved in translation (DUF1610 family)